MKKIISLIRVSLNHDMNIFKINTKKDNKFYKFFLPLFFTFYLMIIMGVYAVRLMDMMVPLKLEFAVLTIFGLLISLITLIEGIYKSGSLLFNCKDDDLLLSLPIKRNTILFIRIFKFYIFELLYNSLFLLPAIIVYAAWMHPSFTYYFSSLIALLLLPIVPILLSCIIGFVIASLSSRFKGKNMFQTLFSTIFLLGILYVTYNIDKWISNIHENVSNINDAIMRLYYPVGAYISLVNDFDIKVLVIYIFSHILIIFIIVFVLGKVYFKINSGFKRVITNHNNKYIVRSSSKMVAFVRKELNKFFSTPVFVTNAGFGLVLFILTCIFFSVKYNDLVSIVNAGYNIDISFIEKSLPSIMFGIVCFGTFMTSITSSMISLEGRTFNILKSLPIRPIEIVLYKVIASLVIIIPCILIGDIIVFVRFKFDIISILLILIASILLPFITELIGIIVNLKYPKIDYVNDTEVVKQSMSSLVSTFIGMGLVAITVILLYKMLDMGIGNHLILLIFLIIYGIVFLVLWMILIKTCDKSFNNINS